VAPQGTLVIVGGEGGGHLLGGVDRQARAMLLSPFVGQRLTAFVAGEDAERLATLDAIVDAGQVTPLVDRTFPLAEAAAAITHLEEGRACGKVVLTI
jgi:NADPH:quinone reductase-like Zn-dependent oxidoreductase